MLDGVVGYLIKKSTVRNCVNKGSYQGTQDYGGIIGLDNEGDSIIDNCEDEYIS